MDPSSNLYRELLFWIQQQQLYRRQSKIAAVLVRFSWYVTINLKHKMKYPELIKRTTKMADESLNLLEEIIFIFF